MGRGSRGGPGKPARSPTPAGVSRSRPAGSRVNGTSPSRTGQFQLDAATPLPRLHGRGSRCLTRNLREEARKIPTSVARRRRCVNALVANREGRGPRPRAIALLVVAAAMEVTARGAGRLGSDEGELPNGLRAAEWYGRQARELASAVPERRRHQRCLGGGSCIVACERAGESGAWDRTK